MIAKCISIHKDRALSGSDLQEIIIDATEIAIQRPSKKQRKYYSGKKKKHTIKVEIQSDKRGKILNISKAYPRRVHDFKIRKSSDHVPRCVGILTDSGYQGLQKIHPKVTLPQLQRERATIRNLQAKESLLNMYLLILKSSKLLAQYTEISEKKLHMRFNIICGIHNLKFC